MSSFVKFPLWRKLYNMVNDKSDTGNMWDGARFVLAKVPLNELEVKKILPLTINPTRPATGTLFITNYVQTSFTDPYKEAALLIDVDTPLGRGVHCPWMVVDDDTALIYGREILGYPKKMASFEFEEDDEKISAAVIRKGVRVLSMEAQKGEDQAAPNPVFDLKTFNPGGMGQFFVFNPVWLFRPREVIHESKEAEVKVKIESSVCDPIDRLITGPPLSGRTVVMDIPGSRYNLITGFTGLGYFARTFPLRFR